MKSKAMKFRFFNKFLVLALMLTSIAVAPVPTSAQAGANNIYLPILGDGSTPRNLELTAAGEIVGTQLVGFNDLCLDLPDAQTFNGNELIMDACTGDSNQNWSREGDFLKVMGHCLDAGLDEAIIWDCHGGLHQQFTATAAGEIKSLYNGKCLDITRSSTEPGAPVIFYHCTGNSNQAWRFVDTSPPQVDGTTIRIYAQGDEGDEQMELRIDGQTVEQWTVSDSPGAYDYTHPTQVSTDQISVHFTNNYLDLENGFDRNLTVDKIVLDGTTYESEDPSVIGTGIWDGSSCNQVAAHRTEMLDCNGYFLYASSTDEQTPQPSNYAENLQRIRNATVRNRNHDNSPYKETPMEDIPIDALLGRRSDYLTEQNGQTEKHFPTVSEGNFRALCEFSHFAYDDPLVYPNEPGAAHLHMFWGNTDVNAYSTYETLFNSGSGTCNGMELNRTGYWAPAMFDNEGNVRIPKDILIYYKGYSEAYGNSEVYPPGAAMIASENINDIPTSEGGAAGSTYSFFCTSNQRHSSGAFNSSNTIPICDGVEYGAPSGENSEYTVLKMNIKFPNCWNRQDPSNPDNWLLPRGGRWYGSQCNDLATFPNLEYFITYKVEYGETTDGWYLASDVNPNSFEIENVPGNTVHGDWWGGWNPEINQQWIDNCTNYRDPDGEASGCGAGYLSDGGPDNLNPYDGPALKRRPQYNGPIKVPDATLFTELCPGNGTADSPRRAAYCTPGEGHGGHGEHGEQSEISSIFVRAKGNQGTEAVDLYINDGLIFTWDVTTEYQEFSLGTAEHIDSIKVGHSSGDWPNAVIVEQIEFNGTIYRSDDPTIESYGSWDEATGCASGYKQSI